MYLISFLPAFSALATLTTLTLAHVIGTVSSQGSYSTNYNHIAVYKCINAHNTYRRSHVTRVTLVTAVTFRSRRSLHTLQMIHALYSVHYVLQMPKSIWFKADHESLLGISEVITYVRSIVTARLYIQDKYNAVRAELQVSNPYKSQGHSPWHHSKSSICHLVLPVT